MKKIFSILPILFFTLLAGCSGETSSWVSLEEGADNSTQITDAGSFTPSTGASVPCPKDGEGNCVEKSENTEPVNLSTLSVDFGLGEENGQECRDITLPGGANYEAEIDEDYGSPELFGIQDASGVPTSERVDGSGTVTVCYLRNTSGTHAARLKLFLTGDSVYAYVIPLAGQTLAKFFTITAPVEGQIVDARQGFNNGIDNDEGDYLLNVAGTVNLDLVPILKNGAQTPIIIDADGVKYRANFDAAGAFAQSIGVPQTPGLYTVKFTVETGKNLLLTREVGIVVAEKPELVIEIRDRAGLEIAAGTPADVENLVIGFRIDNLATAGSNSNSMPVELTSIQLNGQVLHDDTDMWFTGTSWCNNTGSVPAPLSSGDYTGFEHALTYCFPLSSGAELKSGINHITATAKNGIGESMASYDLILDYDKPVITITSPVENEILPNGTTAVTISGTVKNYMPVTSSKPIPDSEDGDTGSWCQDPAGQQSLNVCPPSGVSLWLNSNPGQKPIYIYPEIAGYEDLSEEEIFAAIAQDHPENCRQVAPESGDTTVTRQVCNIPEGRFAIKFTLPNVKLSAKLNLFSNLIEIRAESLKASGSHRTIAVRAFRIGKINPNSFEKNGKVPGNIMASLKGRLHTGQLGSLAGNGSVESEPVLLNISEGLINSPNFKKVLQKLLNDYLPFENLANGWNAWPKNDEDKIDIEAEFQRQYYELEGKHYEDFWQLPDSWQKKFIQQSIHHGNMGVKYWGLIRYAGYLVKHGQADADEAHLLFYEREGDPEDDFNVALDMCGQPITTAFIPLGDLRHVNKPMYDTLGWDIRDIPIKIPEWPDIAGQNIEFNDFVSGKWVVHDVNFKEGAGNEGVIDLDACLVPADAHLDNCNDPIPAESQLPAFWGQFISYNLVEGGLMGPILKIPETLQKLGFQPDYEMDDPTLPMIWNVGKIRVQIRDVIRIRKVKLDNGSWTNRLELDANDIANTKIKLVTNAQKDADFPSNQNLLAENTIQIYPFNKCADYYQSLLDNGTYNDSGWQHLPHGCNQDNPGRNYPVIIERNSATGDLLYNTLFAGGQSTYLLEAIWNGVMETFGKIIRCADTEMVNPIINPEAFPYPKWVPDKNKLSLDVAAMGFGMGINLKHADLNINNADDGTSYNAFTIRLPFDMFVEDVLNKSNFKKVAAKKSGKKTATTQNLGMGSGHLVRGVNQSELNAKPLFASQPERDQHLAASLNLEEIVNSAMHLIFKKGPLSLLKTFGFEDIKVNNNYSVGVDKVVFAQFDICESLSGNLLKTDLPADSLFSEIASQFDHPATHLDIILDKNYPITFSMNPITLSEEQIAILSSNASATQEDLRTHATELQLGITNLQISARELESHGNEYYSIGREVVRVRVDGVVSLKLWYRTDTQSIDVYLDNLIDQNIHLSPVPGKGGVSYDDQKVISSLEAVVLPNIFSKYSRDFNPANDAAPVTFRITLKTATEGGRSLSLTGFNDIGFEVAAESQDNGECVGQKPRYKGKKTSPWKSKTAKGKNQKSVQDKGKKTTGATFSASHVELVPFMDPCSPLDMLKNSEQGNPLAAAICDYGIKDVILGGPEGRPQIILDNNNGYIHLGMEVMIEVYDWLEEEVF